VTTIYAGRVFSVELEQAALADGRQHEVAVVRHPPSVVIIPIVAPGHIILIRQFRHSIGRELWELPAGSLNPGETAQAAAERECEEEVGLRPNALEQIRGLFPAPGFCDEELIFFRAWDLRPPPPDSPRKPDEDEVIHTETFTIQEAKAMSARGDIIDLKTAYGLTLI
jgi:ADP-ribose pyrophosphatase